MLENVSFLDAVVLLEAEEHKLQPEPGDGQHQQHAGKRKSKPAGKVDHVPVPRKESSVGEKTNRK